MTTGYPPDGLFAFTFVIIFLSIEDGQYHYTCQHLKTKFESQLSNETKLILALYFVCPSRLKVAQRQAHLEALFISTYGLTDLTLDLVILIWFVVKATSLKYTIDPC